MSGLLNPDDYAAASPYTLLEAAARGFIGLDHRFLHAILDRRETSEPDLLRFASEDHSQEPINLEEDLLAIFRHWNTASAVPFYIKLIREDPDQISDELLDALVVLGAPALDPLLGLYQELGEENSGDIGFAIAALHVHDPRVLQILTDRLEYDLSDAALCLDLYGDPAAIPALQRMLDKVDAADDRLRTEVTGVIENLGHAQPPSREQGLSDFDIWELYPDEAPPDFDVLSEADRLAMLESESPKRRAEVAGSFFQAELSASARQKLFALAQNDPIPDVRGRAWESLAEHSEEPDIHKALLAVVRDQAHPVEERAGALIALSQETDNPKIFTAIEALYREVPARAKALEAMWRSFDPKFAAYPPKHLKDEDLEIRRHAIWGVGQLGLSKHASQLRPFFDEEELRPDALFNYALSVPTEVTRGRIRALFDKLESDSGGLTSGETELVQMALDQRLAQAGLKPVFSESEDDTPQAVSVKIGRNDPCPCGSGKKHKKCCGA